jgi:hypothetical protein
MGNYNIRKFKRIKDTKESWEYKGIIYQINDNMYDKYYKLSRNIYIKEVNKREIQIQGIINNIKQKKNFELIGKKKSNNIFQKTETISFEIIIEKYIQLKEIKIIKDNNDNTKLKGYNILIKNGGRFF